MVWGDHRAPQLAKSRFPCLDLISSVSMLTKEVYTVKVSKLMLAFSQRKRLA